VPLRASRLQLATLTVRPNHLWQIQVQGKTLDYFIVNLGKRGAGIYPKLSLVDLHVLVSRVRLGCRLFVIGVDENDVDHLRNLRPSETLGVFEHGYHEVTGLWEPERAAAFAAERVAAKTRAADAKGRKRKRPAPTSRAST
jgi:hypothetical protein